MKHFVYILFLFSLFACEETINIESTDSQKQIVINSIISPDSSWNVNLSYSKSIFDNSDFQYINQATVKITSLNTGQAFFLKNIGDGHYGRSLNPTEGHSYEMEVTTAEDEVATARTYLPSVIQVDVIKKDALDEEGNETIEIDIEIEDNPEEENFYVWEIVENIYEENIEDPEGESYVAATLPLELELENQEENLKSLNSLLFISDSEFDGTVYTTKLTLGNEIITKNGHENTNQNPSINPRFNLKVMAVSKDLFEYLRTYELYKQTDIKVTSLTQPVDIYSNIENGLGIFGGFSLKEFPIY
ncbi:MAG: DUF4249 domain-containing protein [Bacteroidia bacterium]|nr:DUF4249 domain-containing protein [Bacteroidia bacterium]